MTANQGGSNALAPDTGIPAGVPGFFGFFSSGVVVPRLNHRLMALMPLASGFREGFRIVSVKWIGETLFSVFPSRDHP